MKFVICLILILFFGGERFLKGGVMTQEEQGQQRRGVMIIFSVMTNPFQDSFVPFSEGSLDTIIPTCEDQNFQFYYDPFTNFVYNKFCHSVNTCYWRTNFFEGIRLYKLIRSGRRLLLSVQLPFLERSQIIIIQTEKCDKNSTISNITSENLHVHDPQKYNDYYKWAPDLIKYSNILYIDPEDEELKIDVVFDTLITRRRCSKVNEKYCKHLCKNNEIEKEVKCAIKISNKDIEIENMDSFCSKESLTSKSEEVRRKKVGNGMCEYFRLNGINPCEHNCIDMPNCSFMCVQEYESQITEMGYQESVLLDHEGFVGSGRWSALDIPDHLVLADECKYNSKLCTNPASCRDKIKGYECINGDYNIKECILNGRSRFWHCPENQSSNGNSTLSSDSFVFSLYEMANKKMELEIKLPKMFTEVSHQYNTFKTWNSSTRKEVSRFTLKMVENVFQSFSLQKLNKDKPVYKQSTELFDAYSSILKQSEREHRIPIIENGTSTETQFIKFNIRENNNISLSSKPLISNFIRYKGLDMMDESAKIDSKVKMKGIFGKSGFNVLENDGVERHKNSDIIYLALSQNTNVTIKFKLKSNTKQFKSPSWLYSFEEECGYLNKKRGWEWSVEGCSKKWLFDKDYYCECNHLSNFAMLFSIKMVNKKHLTVFQYLSVIGATINIVSLILFLIFVLLINSRDKLRLDQLNIAICLLLGTFVFLMGKYTSGNTTLCKMTALFTQFLFLSAFLWKLILGINVVRMITSVRYQNQDSKKIYRLAAICVAYGVPFIITVVSGGFHWSQYGKISEEVCWIESLSNAFLTFLIPIGIILAVNLLILFFIANTLIRNYINTHKTKVNGSNELSVFLQLVVAMGLTWLPSYLATIYLAAMYLWVLFFPLQGLLMFLFVVVITKENREKVSTFVLQKYNSFISKSTVNTDSKSDSKSKSSEDYKNAKQSQILISQTNKDNDESNIPMGVMADQVQCRAPPHNSIC